MEEFKDTPQGFQKSGHESNTMPKNVSRLSPTSAIITLVVKNRDMVAQSYVELFSSSYNPEDHNVNLYALQSSYNQILQMLDNKFKHIHIKGLKIDWIKGRETVDANQAINCKYPSQKGNNSSEFMAGRIPFAVAVMSKADNPDFKFTAYPKRESFISLMLNPGQELELSFTISETKELS